MVMISSRVFPPPLPITTNNIFYLLFVGAREDHPCNPWAGLWGSADTRNGLALLLRFRRRSGLLLHHAFHHFVAVLHHPLHLGRHFRIFHHPLHLAGHLSVTHHLVARWRSLFGSFLLLILSVANRESHSRQNP